MSFPGPFEVEGQECRQQVIVAHRGLPAAGDEDRLVEQPQEDVDLRIK